MTRAYLKSFVGDINQNYFQPSNSNNKHRVLQGNNITKSEATPYRESETKQPLSTYTGDEKRWLVTTADEDLSKGTGSVLSGCGTTIS